MDVCGRWDLKDRLYKGKGEGIAHGVDEDVGDKGGDCFVGKDIRAQGLAKHGEMGISRGGHPVASIERDDVYCLWIEGDIEAALGLARSTKELPGHSRVAAFALRPYLQSILPR
jgi:hypothetical protein